MPIILNKRIEIFVMYFDALFCPWVTMWMNNLYAERFFIKLQNIVITMATAVLIIVLLVLHSFRQGWDWIVIINYVQITYDILQPVGVGLAKISKVSYLFWSRNVPG